MNATTKPETKTCKTCSGTGYRAVYAFRDAGRCWHCMGTGIRRTRKQVKIDKAAHEAMIARKDAFVANVSLERLASIPYEKCADAVSWAQRRVSAGVITRERYDALYGVLKVRRRARREAHKAAQAAQAAQA